VENLFPAGTYLLHTAASAKTPLRRTVIDAATARAEKLHEAQRLVILLMEHADCFTISTHRFPAHDKAGIAFFSLWLTIKEPASTLSHASAASQQGHIELTKRSI